MDGAKILYIEDNIENRYLVRRVLEPERYVVLEADDGIEGLCIAQEEAPDLILLDMNLPGIDGYEVAHRLNKDARTAHILVIALTANVLKGDEERALAAGCDGYIRKPIDTDLLPDQVSSFLKGREWE